MNPMLDLDSREWSRAIAEYSAATNKTLADASNRQVMNLAIQGAKLVKKAEASAIEHLQDPSHWPMWPATVAKYLYRKAGATMEAKAKNKRTRFNELLELRGMLAKGRHYTREQAREYSAKLVRRRLKAVGFVRFFFVSLASAVKPYLSGKIPRSPYSRKFDDFAVNIQPATQANPNCHAAISYNYTTRKPTTARKAERMLDAAMSQATATAIEDMKQETERRLADEARRYSGR